jgi:hypothetical protein
MRVSRDDRDMRVSRDDRDMKEGEKRKRWLSIRFQHH